MRLNRPLVSLLTSPPDPERRVAFGLGDADLLAPRLLGGAAALASVAGGRRGQRWLMQSEDPARVAVALLAAARCGARVALPPNLQPGTLDELAQSSDLVLVQDGLRPDPAAWSSRLATVHRVDPLALQTVPAAPVLDEAAIDRNATLVELFTSGTSGPGKLVPKALRHLEDEVVELERGFGVALGSGAAVVATVPAHHLYGLLFRVLWPLAFGRPFCRDGVLLPDELLARVSELPAAVVVSSPAHLRHLAASTRVAEHAPRIRAVFSSGGPLETGTALALERSLGSAPIEIFGSTETGGVASRRASAASPSPHWTAFAPVAIDVDDGCAVVTSPFVTAPDGGQDQTRARRRMGDRIELDGNGFRLLGRSDRIAKVGEKTLSLPEIEAALATHPLVAAAAACTYAGRSGARLGAVVVLNAAGRLRLAEDGRRALSALLADHLAQRWARVALPRRWRFRDALPVDARGKVAQQTLEAELARPVDDMLEPLLLSQSHDADEHVRQLVVPRDLAYLEGHYDAFPLVPGVVQIHWVMLAIGDILGRATGARQMEAVKFKNVMRPAQRFAMRLRADGPCWNFVLDHDGRVFSSGRVTIAG